MKTFVRRYLAVVLLFLIALAVAKSQDQQRKSRHALEHRLRNFLNTVQSAKALLEHPGLDAKRVKLVQSSLNAEITRLTRFIEDYFP